MWTMENGIITGMKYDNRIFKNNPDADTGGRKTAIMNYVNKLPIGRVFNVNEFLKEHPTIKGQRLEATRNAITEMVKNKQIVQLKNDDYRVLYHVNKKRK